MFLSGNSVWFTMPGYCIEGTYNASSMQIVLNILYLEELY